MNKKIKFSEIRRGLPPLPDWRQLALMLACGAFAAAMARMVVVQNQALEVPFAGETTYIRFMLFVVGFVVLANLYSMAVDANFATLIAAAGILFTVGAAYQFLFGGIKGYAFVGAGTLVAAAVVYAVCRRVDNISDRWYRGIVILIGLLLLVNVIFGHEDKGSKLAIIFGPEEDPIFSIQPGEYVKVLTMILGACSYHNRRRSFIYCATALLVCVVMVGMINDLGNTMVIFVMFVWMTYQLFDNQKLSVGIILAALAMVIVVAMLKDHVRVRFTNWTNVMEVRVGDKEKGIKGAPLQFWMIRSVLFGGIRGHGLGGCQKTLAITAAQHDCALGGVTAIYGIAITTIAMMGYALLVAQPAYNRSVHPVGYLFLGQFSIYAFTQSALNLGGTLDTLPFTGVVAPLISDGKNQMLCFGVLLGLAAAAIHPRIVRKE